MQILKRSAKILSSIFFSLSLTFFLFLFIFFKITSYENVKEIALPFIEAQLNLSKEQAELIVQYTKYQCENASETIINVGKNISLSCKETLSLKPENISNYIASKIFDSLYFEKYNCTLERCVKEKKMTYFISFEFNRFLGKALGYLLLTTILFGGIHLFLIEKPENKLLSLALTFLSVSLPYFSFDVFPTSLRKINNFEIPVAWLTKIKAELKFMRLFFFIGLAFLFLYFLFFFKERGLFTKIK
jgi:hypothetical protein